MDTLEDSSDDGSSSETSDPDEDIFFTDEDADIDESERGNQSFAYKQVLKHIVNFSSFPFIAVLSFLSMDIWLHTSLIGK